MYSNFWIITPDTFWIIIISITFWLTAKGIVMDMFSRSMTRTAVTSFICVMAILVVPACIVDSYVGSTDWIPGYMTSFKVLFPLACAPGDILVNLYEAIR